MNKKNILSAATAASLCIAAGGAFADQPVDKDGPDKQDQWSIAHYITVCSNNGVGNNHEIVLSEEIVFGGTKTKLSCLKFVDGGDLDVAPAPPNLQVGISCLNTADCDPKPVKID